MPQAEILVQINLDSRPIGFGDGRDDEMVVDLLMYEDSPTVAGALLGANKVLEMAMDEVSDRWRQEPDVPPPLTMDAGLPASVVSKGGNVLTQAPPVPPPPPPRASAGRCDLVQDDADYWILQSAISDYYEVIKNTWPAASRGLRCDRILELRRRLELQGEPSKRSLGDTVMVNQKRWTQLLDEVQRLRKEVAMSTNDVPGARPENRDVLAMGCWAEHADGSLIEVLAVEAGNVVYSIFDLGVDPPIEYRDAMPEVGFKAQFSWVPGDGGIAGIQWTWHDKTPFPWEKVMGDFPAGQRAPSAVAVMTAAQRVAESLRLRAGAVQRRHEAQPTEQVPARTLGARIKAAVEALKK